MKKVASTPQGLQVENRVFRMAKLMRLVLCVSLMVAPFSLSAAPPTDKIAISIAVADSDYIFLSPEKVNVSVNVENQNEQAIEGILTVKLTTDAHNSISTYTQPISIQGKTTYSDPLKAFQSLTFAPGFYRYKVSFTQNDTIVGEEKSYTIGVDPEQISSPIDAQPDFKSFWDNNLKELAAVDPQYELTLIPEQSQLDYNTYLVKMQSFGNEPIQGYYTQPKRAGKYPVIVEYMGYGSKPYFPNQQWDGFARFVLSIRGQALNQPTSRFGTWITYGLDSKEDYYYLGAFMDVVRALDFVCSRPEIDADKIGVRGGSQGGALSFVAASLDHRVKAAAPEIPFLSDYRDYFAITHWPREDFERYITENNLPQSEWERIYNILTYFDVKNLTQWITCPVLMGIGVQDEVCPPHTNFAGYNQVKSEKQWFAYPRNGHNTGQEHYGIVMQFFKDKLK